MITATENASEYIIEHCNKIKILHKDISDITDYNKVIERLTKSLKEVEIVKGQVGVMEKDIKQNIAAFNRELEKERLKK